MQKLFFASLRMTTAFRDDNGIRLCSNFCRGFGAALGVERELIGHSEHLLTDFAQHWGVGAMIERPRDPGCDLPHLGFFHAARGYCGGADANTARLHWRIGIERNRVLVYRNPRLSQSFFRLAPEHALGENVDEHEMRMVAAGVERIPPSPTPVGLD